MDLLYVENFVSVSVFDIRLSESELQYLAISMEYLLKYLDNNQLIAEFVDDGKPETPTEAREFLERMWKESIVMLQDHCDPEFLPDRFKIEINRQELD